MLLVRYSLLDDLAGFLVVNNPYIATLDQRYNAHPKPVDNQHTNKNETVLIHHLYAKKAL